MQSMVQEALHAVPYIPVEILDVNNRVDIANEASADPKGTQRHGVGDSNWKNKKDLLTAASDKVSRSPSLLRPIPPHSNTNLQTSR
jgi:hypothetical protein